MNILDISFNDNFSDSESDGFSVNSDISLNSDINLNSDIRLNCDISLNNYYFEEWTEIDLPTPIIDNFEIINNK